MAAAFMSSIYFSSAVIQNASKWLIIFFTSRKYSRKIFLFLRTV